MNKVRKNQKRFRRSKKVWQIQEAKARFSELVNEVEHNGYQTITKNGHPVAIIISKDEFEKLQTPKNTLVDFFREAPHSEVDIDIQRSGDLGRDVDL